MLLEERIDRPRKHPSIKKVKTFLTTASYTWLLAGNRKLANKFSRHLLTDFSSSKTDAEACTAPLYPPVGDVVKVIIVLAVIVSRLLVVSSATGRQ